MRVECSYPLLMRRATTEHAGESGVQLSVGAGMEAYGDQAAAASIGRGQARSPSEIP